MVASSKILTVTYGSFSCTLEGFDDPFTTLQQVAEYFRKLAAQDRHFGGQPQLPDTNTLKAIAEANVSHGVSAELEENGVILRQSEAEAKADTAVADNSDDDAEAPVAVFRTSRTELENAEEDENIAAAAAGIAAVGAAAAATNSQAAKRSVQATLAAIRKNVEQAESEIDLASDDDSDIEEAEILTNQSDEQSDADEPSIFAETEEEPEAQAAPEVTEAEVAQAEEEQYLSAPELNEETAAVEPDDAEEPVAEDVTERAVEEAQEEATEPPVEADAVAEVIEEAAPEVEVSEAEAEVEETAEVPAEPLAEAVEETPEPTEEVEAALEEETSESPAEVDAVAEVIEEAALEVEVSEAEAEVEETAEVPAEPLAEAGEETPEPTEEVEAALEEIAEEAPETSAETQAPAPVAEPETAQSEAPETETLETEVEVAEIEEETDYAETSTLSEEEEADLARALAEALDEDESAELSDEGYSPEVVNAAEELVADLESVPDEDDRRAERRARAAAMLDQTTDDSADGTLDRLLETTRTKMDRPEQQRRLNALDQLKAAVAATEAENQLRAVRGRDDDREAAEANAFRNDLRDAEAVPRTGERQGRPAIRPERREATPLILVSEQRIDDEPAQPSEVDPSREVAETDGNLALKRQPETTPTPEIEEFADEIQGIPADAFHSDNFPDFAERVGAFDMHDLLEAAAAYTTIVEGLERFSRAEVMNKIAGLNHAEGYSKEQGLRAFGKLLREGKILRVQDGHFAIARSSRYSVASRDS